MEVLRNQTPNFQRGHHAVRPKVNLVQMYYPRRVETRDCGICRGENIRITTFVSDYMTNVVRKMVPRGNCCVVVFEPGSVAPQKCCHGDPKTGGRKMKRHCVFFFTVL